MKRLLFIVVLGLIAGGLNAEAGNRLTKVGYVGNVGLTISAQGPGCDVISSHGYSFGNGLWMGGGAGFSFSNHYGCIYLPVFAEVKYAFNPEKKVAPFVDCKLGYMTELDHMFGFVSPAVGIDIDRFSVFASYNICSRYIYRDNNSLLQTVHFGFAFNF